MQPQSPAAFISYSREDSVFAMRLAQDLKAAGASVWLDQLDILPGAPWDNAVEEALSSAPQMLLILSPASVSSHNVRDEMAYAEQEGKTIVPVLYRDCKLPLQLLRKQRIDFRENYPQALEKLVHYLAGHPALVSTEEIDMAQSASPASPVAMSSAEPVLWKRISGRHASLVGLVFALLAGVAAWIVHTHQKADRPASSVIQPQSSSEFPPSPSSPSSPSSESGSSAPTPSGKKNPVGRPLSPEERSVPQSTASFEKSAQPTIQGNPEGNKPSQPLESAVSTSAPATIDVSRSLPSVQKEAGRATYSLRTSFKGGHGFTNTVAFSPNRRILAAGNEDGSIDFRDSVTGAPLRHFDGDSQAIFEIAFSPDGHILASIGGYGIKAILWNADTGDVLRVLSLPSKTTTSKNGSYTSTPNFFSAAFSPDGHTLVTGNSDAARLWDLETGAVKFVLKGGSEGIHATQFSPNGRIVASSGGRTVWLWDAFTGKLLRTLQLLKGPDSMPGVSVMAFNPDSQTLAWGGDETAIYLWDVESGKQLAILDADSPGAASLALVSRHSIRSLAFTPDGHTLLSSDEKIRRWDLTKRSMLPSSGNSPADVLDFTLSPDGHVFAALTFGGRKEVNKVELWEISNLP